MRRRYGKYFTAGRAFARAIGNPLIMRYAVEHGFPHRRLMRFALRMLANLTDGPRGDVDDRVMDWILRISPMR